MHNLQTIIITTFLCFFTCSSFAQAEIIDRIVAEVNGEVLTLSELNEHAKPFFQKVMEQAPANIVEKEIQKIRIELLDRLIDDLLMEQEAQKFDIAIMQSDLDNAVNSIMAENNVTADQFRQELLRMGTNEESYRQNIKNQMLKSRLINIEIRSKLVITDERIQKYYDTFYQEQGDAPEGYGIMQIGFAWGENFKSKSQEEAMQTAEMVKRRLEAGEEFTNLAMQYSDLPSAEDGGDIGSFSVEEMAQYMLTAVKNMHPGQISDIIQTPTGFQILKLKSRNLGGVMTKAPIDTVKNEIKEIIYKQEMEKEYDKWMNNIREKAFIKKML